MKDTMKSYQTATWDECNSLVMYSRQLDVTHMRVSILFYLSETVYQSISRGFIFGTYSYLRNPWMCFDFVITLVSLPHIEITKTAKFQLQSLRGIRIFDVITIIPARSECLIQGIPEVPGQFRYAATDFHSQVPQKGVLVAATLVDLEREAIPVRVLNLNNTPKILDKGAVIATCEPVVDIVARTQEFSETQHLSSILESLEMLNEKQRREVRKLLKEFQNLFSTCDADVDHCNMTQHRINTGDHPPIKQYPRCLPLARKEEADHLVKDMLGNGIIEESSGPWVSPIVLVKKKDGSTRFCVDYRKLNEITKKDSYPLPRIDNTLDSLNGSQWFTTLDL
ncbi:Retrovirus-related Pol polyprotein from transposon 297 [Araneus ventricosus]|uniref:Retrovirus-related Pol polyprotein from transposon 297 n=1 Tax=Araneus ventricosus TaxID=182803 RepID=A0A4Y2HZA1_ARAVE|nr:Retrovirus-related Pol polyprotein from transposon 297 [Araneus ventricosus]